MIEFTDLLFLKYSLAAGLLLSIACGVIGTLIVAKRISVLSGSISHSAFGGIGISYYFGFPPLWGAALFGVISSAIMGLIRMKYREREDMLIGATWSMGMAIGILFIYKTPGYASDLNSYLFGNILLVSKLDLYLLVGLTTLIAGAIVANYRAFQAITFDEDYATALNLPVTRLYLWLLSLVALTVVGSIRVVGIILVVALLSLPAAAAERFSKTLKGSMILASLIGILATTLGTLSTVIWDVPASPIIIFLCFGVYLLSLLKKTRFF